LISAFVALSLTPALCSLFLKPMNINKGSKGLNKFFFRFNTWFAKVTNSYSGGVQRAIKATPYMLVLLVCIMAGTAILFKNKPSGFIPTEDEGRLFVTYELPEASSTTRSLEVLNSIMANMKETPGIAHYAALGGFNIITGATKSNSGTVFTQLKPWDQRKDKSLQLAAIAADVQKRLSSIKGATIRAISPPAIPGLGQTGGFTFELQQRESTDDIKQFEKVVNTFVGEMNKRPEIASAYSYFTARTPGYKVDVDREKCKKLGVSISDVYTTLQTYLGSRYVNDFTIYGRNFRVVAQADTLFRADIKNLEQYYVRNQTGTLLPLSTVISYQTIESAPLITHYNLFRTAEVNGSPKEGYSSGQAIQALRETADKVLPAGYGYEFSGLSREEINAGSSTVYIFSLSILFVFLIPCGII
jgi:HAE1 family hydrophobic/amphiphilic exporter-1